MRRGLTQRLWSVVAALVLLAVVTPIVLHALTAALPVVVVIAATVIVLRLVWHYTNRY
jgi:hypothetical protein